MQDELSLSLWLKKKLMKEDNVMEGDRSEDDGMEG